MSGVTVGAMVCWRSVASARSDSKTWVRASAWASIRATVVSTERSSGVKATGWGKATIQVPMVRPPAMSGRYAQAARWKAATGGHACG